MFNLLATLLQARKKQFFIGQEDLRGRKVTVPLIFVCAAHNQHAKHSRALNN